MSMTPEVARQRVANQTDKSSEQCGDSHGLRARAKSLPQPAQAWRAPLDGCFALPSGLLGRLFRLPGLVSHPRENLPAGTNPTKSCRYDLIEQRGCDQDGGGNLQSWLVLTSPHRGRQRRACDPDRRPGGAFQG